MANPAIKESDLNTFITAGGSVGLCPADSNIIKFTAPRAVRIVEAFLGWRLIERTADEYYPSRREPYRMPFGIDIGYGATGRYGQAFMYGANQANTMLSLRGKPVRSITNIWDGPGAYSESQTPTWTDDMKLAAGSYYLDSKSPGMCWSGLVIRPGGWYQTQPRTVRVQYVCGLTAAELADDYADVQYGLLLTIAFLTAKTKAAAAIAKSKGVAAGRMATGFSVEDFSAQFNAGGGSQQFGVASGGGTGGAGAGIPDDALPYLANHIKMSKWLPD